LLLYEKRREPMPSFRVGGIWVLKIEKFLSYALIFYTGKKKDATGHLVEKKS
jgi:hypothetical protein